MNNVLIVFCKQLNSVEMSKKPVFFFIIGIDFLADAILLTVVEKSDRISRRTFYSPDNCAKFINPKKLLKKYIG